MTEFSDHKEEYKEHIFKLINTSSNFLLWDKLANEEMIEKGGFVYCLYV